MSPDPFVILEVVFASILYASLFYASKRPKGEAHKFDPVKFAATLAVGVGVGIWLWSMGDPLTEASMAVQLSIYGTIVALVERLIKFGYNTYQRYKRRRQTQVPPPKYDK